MSAKVLVTGAGGFTGRYLVKQLISSGYSVRAMVRSSKQCAEFWALGAEPVVADLNDPASLKHAVKGVSGIFHIAALFRKAGFPDSEFFRVNVEGTRNLLDAAVAAGVKRMIHCSTVGVLGHIETAPATEDSPYNPGDPYQQSKMEGEKLFLDYVGKGKIRGMVIRPAMIYGPGDKRTEKLFRMINKGSFFYVGPGTALVHWVDVRDLARAFQAAYQREHINGEVVIVAGETSLPLSSMVRIVSALMGSKEPWLHLPVRAMQELGSLCEFICKPLRIDPPLFRRRVDFFTKDRCFDCTKARHLLDFVPSQSFVGELSDIIDSYVASGILDLSLANRPSLILRHFDGKIFEWGGSAPAAYGWSKKQALGAVSHTLLGTEFPQSLEVINQRLKSSGSWRGSLRHERQDGKRVTVSSQWQLIQAGPNKETVVLELNKQLDKEDRIASIAAAMQAASLSASGYMSELNAILN